MPYEVSGPPSFEEWLAAFRVFAMAMRAVGAATGAKLLQYENKVRRFNETYGHACWWLVAQADQRMRGEHLDRLRRRLETERAVAVAEGRPHPLDPAKPWDYVFKAAAADDTFWNAELVQKAVLYATHLQTQSQLSDPGHGVAALGGHSSAGRSKGGGKRNNKRKRDAEGSAPSWPADPPKGKAKGKGKKGGKDNAKGSRGVEGQFRTTRAGLEICWPWNRATDGCSATCPSGRAHVCEWCRGAGHRGIECTERNGRRAS